MVTIGARLGHVNISQIQQISRHKSFRLGLSQLTGITSQPLTQYEPWLALSAVLGTGVPLCVWFDVNSPGCTEYPSPLECLSLGGCYLVPGIDS
jgi:hypothetical protein